MEPSRVVPADIQRFPTRDLLWRSERREGPRPEGTLRTRTLADGTRVFELRFRSRGRRHSEVLHERRDCGCCGGGWTELRARVEVQNALARVAAGIWEPRQPVAADAAGTSPWRFDEYATHWLGRWACGALGG